MKFWEDRKIRNAIMLGTLCSVSYLAVYLARNVLGAVSPQMIESGKNEEFIGSASSVYFIFYAVGQLINGAIGDKIKARNMISFGLIFAGVTNLIFPYMADFPNGAIFVYGMTGFFLSMIYGPMTKVVAENTEPVYATRCSLGYTFASFFGSPLAGILATVMVWSGVFTLSSIVLFIMGAVCFFVFLAMEKSGVVKYNQFDKPKTEKGGGIKILIEHRIIKFTFISILTGVIRTSVVFWLPTYIWKHLGFSSAQSTTIFTVATLVISTTTFISVFIYEKLKRNMDLTILISFSVSALSFLIVYILKQPVLNIIFMVTGIMGANSASTMMWSRYCPSLRDTGMVSGATGFLDFVSYMAASASNMIFAGAATKIGWGNLILVWFGLMVIGIIVAMPHNRVGNNRQNS